MDYGLALLSGVLLALSFPKFGHPAFAWIALVPLFIALAGWRRVGHARGLLGDQSIGKEDRPSGDFAMVPPPTLGRASEIPDYLRKVRDWVYLGVLVCGPPREPEVPNSFVQYLLDDL